MQRRPRSADDTSTSARVTDAPGDPELQVDPEPQTDPKPQTDPAERMESGVVSNGTQRTIDGRACVYYDGYFLKYYPVPEDNLVEKRRLVSALTRRLFNHVEHGLYIPSARLDEARRAYESETDADKKRIKGGMLAGALFNGAADILTKLIELQDIGVTISSSDPLMRRCGAHLQEALALGRSVRHRSGEEGIDELWGEPFKAFAYPIADFYRSRYVKLAMTMRCVDQLAEQSSRALGSCPGMEAVSEPIHRLAEAAKDYAQTRRSDAEVFDCWSTLAVAREKLDAFVAQLPHGCSSVARDLAEEAEWLTRELSKLLFYIARARVPMPKSAADICLRARALAERASSLSEADTPNRPPPKADPPTDRNCV